MLFEWILKTVQVVIDRFGLLHPGELADCHGIHVLSAPMKRIHGGLIVMLSMPLVVLNDSLPHHRQLGALLHEVAHKVLHPGTNRFMDNPYIKNRCGKYELEAHLFALIYALMWDRQGFEDSGYNVKTFAEMYGLSRSAADVVAREIETRGPVVLEALGLEVPSL